MSSDHSLVEQNPVLAEILTSGLSQGAAGAVMSAHSGIDEPYAEALYRMVLNLRPACCLEIGMAYGVSSLAILTALRQIGEGRLTSIDPNQSTEFSGAGSQAVRRAGLDAYHTLIERPDFQALPALLDDRVRLDFAYIDGWHTFDYTLLDFFYIDKMLNVGGVVGFNDCGFASVDRVLRFVRSHRRYAEIEVGLPRFRPGLPYVRGAARYLLGGPRSEADRYFRKTQAWEPDWDFYTPLEPVVDLYAIVKKIKGLVLRT